MPSDIAFFLRQLARNPMQTSAIAPSSALLARAMVAGLGPNSGPVVEFGPGTGAFTRAILKSGVLARDITLFELNPEFAVRLRARFPGVTVHLAGAQDIAKYCPPDVGTIISGLPLLSMPTAVCRAIVGGAFSVLRPGAAMVQFTYGTNPPIAKATLAALGLTAVRRTKVWINLPPATVYAFRRRAELK